MSDTPTATVRAHMVGIKYAVGAAVDLGSPAERVLALHALDALDREAQKLIAAMARCGERK